MLIDSELIIHVFNENISNEQKQTLFSLSFHPTENITIENIESIIKILDSFNSFNVCYGAVPVNNYPDIKESFGYQYQNINGVWKHSSCSKILPENR